MRSFADTSNHEIVRTSGATINIGPSSTEKTDDAIQSTQDNSENTGTGTNSGGGIGGGLSTTINIKGK
ncbi:MAG: hypothetical protein ACK5LC_01095, partial [Coprobacillaceae bacterium]